MNFLAQLGQSPRCRPSLPWKQARREPCQRRQSGSNIVGPMAVTFTQPNFVACMPRGDPSEFRSVSQTSSSARFGAASIASSDTGCRARHTRNLPQGAKLSATCSKRVSRKTPWQTFVRNQNCQLPIMPCRSATPAICLQPILLRNHQRACPLTWAGLQTSAMTGGPSTILPME